MSFPVGEQSFIDAVKAGAKKLPDTPENTELKEIAKGFVGQEATHLLVADPRDHGCAQAQPGHAECDVGRTAAQVLGEARHIFERCAHLLRVQVHGEAAQAGEVMAAAGRNVQGGHAGG